MPLGDLVAKRVHHHTIEWTDRFQAKSREISIPKNPEERTSGHGLLGIFYEHLHKGLYGGKLPRELLPEVSSNRLPDIVRQETKTIAEVKGSVINNTTQLRDEQIEFYRMLQANHPSWEIKFAIYRHRFPAIKSFTGPEQALFHRLTQGSTLYATILPFDVILRLHDHDGIEHLVHKYEENGKGGGRRPYETCTCINATTLHDLLFRPEALLADLGFTPGTHTIARQSTPNGVHVNGERLHRIPVLRIRRNNYAAWATEWRERYEPDPEFCADNEDPLEQAEKLLGEERVPPPSEEDIPF